MTAETPNGGYGVHSYRLEDHGLEPETERQKFGSYMATFGNIPETVAQGTMQRAGHVPAFPRRKASAPRTFLSIPSGGLDDSDPDQGSSSWR